MSRANARYIPSHLVKNLQSFENMCFKRVRQALFTKEGDADYSLQLKIDGLFRSQSRRAVLPLVALSQSRRPVRFIFLPPDADPGR